MNQHKNNHIRKNPLWFKIVNLTFLIPVIFWPLVFFASIFIFDNPSNLLLAFLLFLLIIGYPLYLLLLLLFNARLFKKNRLIASLFPLAFSTLILYYAFSFLGGPSTIFQFLKQIGAEPPPETNYENVIGFNYRKDSVNLYYGDTLVPGADLPTFELINFHWAKDKNKVYYNGRPVSKIDRKTFKYLNSGYSTDTNHVFYDTTVVDGADIATFIFIANSLDGKDKNFCYRQGQKIECSRLSISDANHR